MPKRTTGARPELKLINVGAAAIDIGSRMHMAAVNPAASNDAPVRSFGTFTQNLHDLADWFKACGVTSVAMESTGIYWIPVYEILEQRGFDVILVNARYAKNVPGRKTDVSDAAWLRELHSYGLLRGSFRPDAEIATLRAYLRQRERLVEYAAAHIQHMQKALMEMNLQLHHVVTDITGATGMRIIRAIVAGERNPDVLATYRDVRCHSSVATIRAALVGNDRHEHVFALTQSLELYDVYQAKMLDCDRKLEVLVAALNNKGARPVGTLCKPRIKTKQVNAPTFDVRTALYRVLGVDLTEIHGLGPSLALKLVGECGTDLRAWPSAKHFTSWLCLAPGNKISGGKVLSSRTRRSTSRAAALLRLAATTIGRSDTALGAFYRRLSSRAGKSKAVTATARKIAVLFYNTLRYGMSYRDPGAEHYEQQYRSRVLANLRRRAKSLGFVLQAIPEDANPAVSKEVHCDLCWSSEMRFRFIEDCRADYPVTIMCGVLGVSPAGYYAWRSRPESQRSAANRELVDDIRRVHRETNGRYGSPRVHAELRAHGRGASRGRIERLMRRHGIRAIMAKPRRVRTTDSRHDFPIAPNLLERNFIATAPNRIWLADITYVETEQGWLYLATLMDLYSRKIVGWAMADHLRAELPMAALAMAIATQRPGAGLIHHSDRGVQYASAEYRKMMQSAGFRASMSRKADCYDNAPMESFFHTLKTELVHQQHYETREEARRDIFAYIEGFYNRKRRHSAIGYISPIEMELKAA